MSAKRTAQLLRLVPMKSTEVSPCKETIETLTWLLHEAAAGRITGIAYGAMMPGRDFVVDVVGDAYKDPLRGIGLAQYVTQEIVARHMGIK